MNGFFARVLVGCTIAVLAMHSPLAAEWQMNGNSLKPSATGDTSYPKVCSDGRGGAIVAWIDGMTGGTTYAQRIDGDGNPLWASNGVPMTVLPANQANHRIIADGAGGAIVAWEDHRDVGWDIYAQKVNAAGVVQWDPAGVPVCIRPGDQTQIVMVSDQRGGVIIVWADERHGNRDLYFARIDASGTVIWGPSGGIQLTDDPLDQASPAIASDGTGGFIVAWQDERAGGMSDIYATRIGGDGGWAWGGLNGLAVCTVGGWQQGPVIASDDAGGAIIAWQDTRQGPEDIYAQRMNASGVAKWAIDGIPVCTTGNINRPLCAVSDGAGSAYIGWSVFDFMAGIYTLYAQRVTRAGAIQWPVAGFRFSSGEGNQAELHFVSARTDGIIATWSENRFGTPDIYAQKVDASGAAQWTEDGVPLCDAFNWQYWTGIVTDGAGGAIVTWSDFRNDTYAQAFAQRVTAEGFWGYPAPGIRGVRDIPGDQGGSVNLAWDASRLDPGPEHLIDRYTIWRAISPTAAAPLLAGGARLIADASELRVERESEGAAAADLRPGSSDRVLRPAEINGESYYWDLVLTTNAYYLSNYSKVVPTLFDSTATSDERHYFQVIAHTDDPYVFFVSEPDSGCSVDNLAPAPPLGLSGEQVHVPEGLTLVWDPNAEPDLGGYHIYRGLTEGFVPGPSNLLASTPDTMLFDGGWRWSSGYFYKVAAVDIHGNESAYALLRPDNVTAVDNPGTPHVDYLSQNFPNPFNPVTRIEFGVASRVNVTLRIYDAAGRLVRTLVDETTPPGKYAKTWDGSTSAGAAAASGIYFYRLDAGAYTETRKMVLLR